MVEYCARSVAIFWHHRTVTLWAAFHAQQDDEYDFSSLLWPFRINAPYHEKSPLFLSIARIDIPFVQAVGGVIG